jgi:hypothetical protein
MPRLWRRISRRCFENRQACGARCAHGRVAQFALQQGRPAVRGGVKGGMGCVLYMSWLHAWLIKLLIQLCRPEASTAGDRT